MGHHGKAAGFLVWLLVAAIVLLGKQSDTFAGVTPCKSAILGSASFSRRNVVARHSGSDGMDELMQAAHGGDDQGLAQQLKAGADVNSHDNYGWTPLRYAVRNNQPSTAYMLIEAGADVNLASKSGRTPLMSAAGNKLLDMVRMLIDAGADKELKDKSGLTAYNIALRGGGTGCPECRTLLTF